MTDIQEDLDGVSRKLDEVLHIQSDQGQQSVFDWLTSTDFSLQQNNFFGSRQKGTGKWFLESSEFERWVSGKERTLFCPGIPGAGKTIITSIVVDHLREKFRDNLDVGVAFLYCNFRQQQEQQPIHLFLSLLRQLAQRQPFLPQAIVKLHQEHQKDRTRPSLDKVSTVLQSVLLECSKAFIIIDALDECSATSTSRVLEELFNLQAKTETYLFATSRPIPDIVSRFKRQGCGTLEIYGSAEDLGTYIDGHVHQLPTFVNKTTAMSEKIKTAIINAANGM